MKDTDICQSGLHFKLSLFDDIPKFSITPLFLLIRKPRVNSKMLFVIIRWKNIFFNLFNEIR